MKVLLFLIVMIKGFKISERNCKKCHALELNHSKRVPSRITRGCKMIKSTCHLVYECSVYNNCGLFHVRSRKKSEKSLKLSYNNLTKKILSDPFRQEGKILTTSFRWGKMPSRNSKKLISWKSCPTPEKSEGIRKIACDGATCIPICAKGYKAFGKNKKMDCKRIKKDTIEWSKSIKCLKKNDLNNSRLNQLSQE